jgi:hypothetical protein
MIAQTGKFSVMLIAVLCAGLCIGADGPAVKIEPLDKVGPRPLEEQTKASVIKDYLEAWRGIAAAFDGNEPGLLDAYFVGEAKRKLADTVHEQVGLDIRTSYRDKSHNIKVVFYSPEGLSIELIDDVEYEVEVRDRNEIVGSQVVRCRCTAVLTPTEARWKVRIFQGGGST